MTIDFAPSEFIYRCENGMMTEELLIQEGPIWAIRWATVKDEEKEDLKEINPKEPGSWEGCTLAHVPWGTHHVRALLSDVDDSVRNKTLPSENRVPWMDKNLVNKTLRGVKVGDLERMFQDLAIGGKEEGEDVDMRD